MKINVKTSTNNYDVVILKGVLDKCNEYLFLDRKVLIVTDDNIPLNYINSVKKHCKEAFIYTIKAGEQSKNFKNYESILSFMVENKFTRFDAVVAIGGGVVGDLAGFVASTYNRGITFYNIPTTLLSQVDSSIGGKTAIDLLNVKNAIGTFYPPECVLIDPLTLNTLDKRQLHAGLIEALKMAITFDVELFNLICSSDNLLNDIETIICKSLQIKKYVVENDEKENNLRRVLNFGHTIGHAIESDSNMSLLHGECVALGMLYFVNDDLKGKLIDFYKKLDIPTYYSYDKDRLFSYIDNDKKTDGNNINIICCEKIGSFIIKKITLKQLKEYL